MKILVVGDGHSKIHEVAVTRALEEMGHAVRSYYWQGRLASGNPLLRLFRKAQNKFIVGPAVGRINRDLLAAAREFEPEFVFVYRGTHIRRRTVERLRALPGRPVVAGYNNDDPFAPGHPGYLWRTFLRAVPAYDIVYAYRHHNLPQFEAAGARRVGLLRSWYLPWMNRPVELGPAERAEFESDVVFIGHFEDDGRAACLEEIVRRGWRLRLFGPPETWRQAVAASRELSSLPPVRMVWGDDYNRALCGAKLALCFLSKLNRDTYTRRCFEIPATGTLLLSEYTDDLAGLFAEGSEALYFRDPGELMAAVERCLGDDGERRAIARAGQAKVAAAGHDIHARLRRVLEDAQSIRRERGAD